MIKMFKSCKKGFTLLELLVVVLIIGILASIALPQYNKAVEKAKVTEALLNIKALEESEQRYILANGYPQSIVVFEDFADIELSGGEWNEGIYYTKNFEYQAFVGYIEVHENNYKYTFVIADQKHRCYTNDNDIGRYICKYLEPQGWNYNNGEL